MSVDHEQQIHLLSIPDQPLRDFHGHLPAHAESTEVVRTFGLQLTYFAEVTIGHRLGRREVFAVAVQPLSLESVKRVVGAKMARQLAVDQDVAASSVHAKKWRFASSRLNRYQRTPARRPAVFPNEVRQLFNR